MVSVQDDVEDRPVRPRSVTTAPDRLFRGVSTAAAFTSLVIVGLTAIYLVVQSRPALHAAGVWRFYTTSVWNPGTGHFGVLGLLIGGLIIAVIGGVVAVPLALALALFINEYAPPRLRRPMTSVVDLLAALPSLLFGMWGFFAFQHQLIPVAKWLGGHGSTLPFFRLPAAGGGSLTQSSFVAGMVVGMMMVPLITSISRDVMAQTPREQVEGALALGGTRWGMIRTVILPFGRSGIVGATLLALGRGLGETIAVALIITFSFKANFHVLTSGAGSIPALIATKFAEATPLEQSALVAAGLGLFVLTMVINLAARRIVARAATVS
jgi:phosphate transport system permease protein